jgi:hypothetical protein
VSSLQIARFLRERETLYVILDPDERNRAFVKLHFEWFREWGLEQPLTDVLREFPLGREQLGVLAMGKSAGKNDEGAELCVNDVAQRTGLLALRPERLVRPVGKAVVAQPDGLPEAEPPICDRIPVP